MKFANFIVLAIVLQALPLQSGFSATNDWNEFDFSTNSIPINLSHLLDAPAGKHGFLGVSKDRFVFENGAEFRIWGVSMNGEACFPSQELAPKIAERLSHFAVNLVCFRNFDTPDLNPPFFNPAGGQLNAERMDRLDYFLYQLESRGIYASFIGMESRKLSEADGVEEWQDVPEGMKGYIHFVPELRDSYVRYQQEFWLHRNRYSGGRQYRDTPSIALAQLFHENTIQPTRLRAPMLNTEIYNLWDDWREEYGIETNEALVDRDPSPENRRFLSKLLNISLADFKNKLRHTGVNIPIAGVGWLPESKDLLSMESMDFVMSEQLWNEPLGRSLWHSGDRIIDLDPEEQSNPFARWSATRMKNKPFISMWKCPSPNRHRAEFPLWLAAMATFQDWNGCVHASYANQLSENRAFIETPMMMDADPAVMGLFPAAALMFHQRHIEPAKKSAAIGMADEEWHASEQWTPESIRPSRLNGQMRIAVDWQSKPGRDRVYSPSEPATINDVEMVPLRKRPIRHDLERKLVLINSPKSQAFIGTLSKAIPDDLPDIRILSGEPFGVFCVNALDDQPIAKSHSLWLTLISESQNAGFRSSKDENGTYVQSIGGAPVQLKSLPARLFVRVKHRGISVDAVSPTGESLHSIPHQIQDEWLSFRAGTHACMHYRISFESEG